MISRSATTIKNSPAFTLSSFITYSTWKSMFSIGSGFKMKFQNFLYHHLSKLFQLNFHQPHQQTSSTLFCFLHSTFSFSYLSSTSSLIIHAYHLQPYHDHLHCSQVIRDIFLQITLDYSNHVLQLLIWRTESTLAQLNLIIFDVVGL